MRQQTQIGKLYQHLQTDKRNPSGINRGAYSVVLDIIRDFCGATTHENDRDDWRHELESTSTYYREINEGIKNTLGGLHSAKIALYSVDFGEIEKLQHADDWETTATILTQAAQAVEAGGADFLLICTNTMHKVAPQIEAGINIPLIHIADATAEQLQRDGVERVGLLGTRFTMEQDFIGSSDTAIRYRGPDSGTARSRTRTSGDL